MLCGKLGEEGLEHHDKSVPHLPCRCLSCLVIRRTWHNEAVIEPKGDEKSCQTIEHKAPCKGFLVAEFQLKNTRYRHQNTVSEYHRKAIEGVADANIPRLVVVVEFQHVVTVGSNVVSGAAESHEEEEEHRALKPERGIQRERNSGK